MQVCRIDKILRRKLVFRTSANPNGQICNPQKLSEKAIIAKQNSVVLHPASYILHVVSCILFLTSCILSLAQTTFSKRNVDIGIDHAFKTDHSLIGGGAAFFDYNNDGYEDLYIVGGTDRDKLYMNNGDGTFTDKGIEAGLTFTSDVVTIAVSTGDIDNDGYRDVFVCTSNIFQNILLKNNGDGTFSDISIPAGITHEKAWSMSVSFGDINLDGFLDIYVGNYIEINRVTYDDEGEINGFAHDCYPNFLYINDGNPDSISFTEMSGVYGGYDRGCALASAFTDYDQDGDVDLLVANDFGQWVMPNKLLQNEYPESYFVDESIRARLDAPMYGMGIAVGDFDQDADLDYYVTNLGRNALFLNDNDGTFQDVTSVVDVEDIFSFNNSLSVGWGTAFLDVDLDTDLDLLVANGHIPAVDFIANIELSPDRLFINNGDYSFSELASQAGSDDVSISRGLAYADYDNDGDIDYLIIPTNNMFEQTIFDKVVLFQNDLETANNWLKIKLEGTISNRDAYGAQIKIKVGFRTWLHEVHGGSSHASQNSSIAHFGLGDGNQADSVWVVWPGGNQQLFIDLQANQTIHIKEDPERFIATSIKDNIGYRLGLKAYPNPFSESVTIEFDQPGNRAYDLYVIDINGKIVRSMRNLRGNKTQIQRENLASGMYTLMLRSDDGKIDYEKLVIN